MGFNSQPPEGGCFCPELSRAGLQSFNSQPPEGGCGSASSSMTTGQSFNSQPPEGGCVTAETATPCRSSVSTHSRPKAAAYPMRNMY